MKKKQILNRGNYMIIPLEFDTLAKTKIINFTQYRILITIFNSDEKFQWSQQKLSTKLGIAKKNINQQCQDLKEKGILEYHTTPFEGTEYEINWDYVVNPIVVDDDVIHGAGVHGAGVHGSVTTYKSTDNNIDNTSLEDIREKKIDDNGPNKEKQEKSQITKNKKIENGAVVITTNLERKMKEKRIDIQAFTEELSSSCFNNYSEKDFYQLCSEEVRLDDWLSKDPAIEYYFNVLIDKYALRDLLPTIDQASTELAPLMSDNDQGHLFSNSQNQDYLPVKINRNV